MRSTIPQRWGHQMFRYGAFNRGDRTQDIIHNQEQFQEKQWDYESRVLTLAWKHHDWLSGTLFFFKFHQAVFFAQISYMQMRLDLQLQFISNSRWQCEAGPNKIHQAFQTGWFRTTEQPTVPASRPTPYTLRAVKRAKIAAKLTTLLSSTCVPRGSESPVISLSLRLYWGVWLVSNITCLELIKKHKAFVIIITH